VVIEEALDDTSGARDGVRGNALREFGAFLKANDAASTFSGMKRLCDTASGRAIWVTEESAQKIALENDSSTTETEEVKQLKAEKERRETELAKSKAEEVQKSKVENDESLEIDKKKWVAETDEMVEEKKLQKQQLEEDSDCVWCVLM
jgi:hypothetical protein